MYTYTYFCFQLNICNFSYSLKCKYECNNLYSLYKYEYNNPSQCAFIDLASKRYSLSLLFSDEVGLEEQEVFCSKELLITSWWPLIISNVTSLLYSRVF